MKVTQLLLTFAGLALSACAHQMGTVADSNRKPADVVPPVCGQGVGKCADAKLNCSLQGGKATFAAYYTKDNGRGMDEARVTVNDYSGTSNEYCVTYGVYSFPSDIPSVTDCLNREVAPKMNPSDIASVAILVCQGHAFEQFRDNEGNPLKTFHTNLNGGGWPSECGH